MKSLFTILFITTCYYASATIVTWDHGAATSNWTDVQNWDNDMLPTTTDTIEIQATFTVIIGAAQNVVSGKLNIDGDLTINGILTIDGVLTNNITNLGSLTIYGALFIQNASGSSAYNGLISNGTLINNGTITIVNVGGINISNNGTFDNNGDINLSNNGASYGLYNNGTFNNNSAATIDLSFGGELINYGIFNNKTGASIEIMNTTFGFQNIDTLINDGSIMITNSNSTAMTNYDLIVNNGSISLNQSGNSALSQLQSEFINNGTLTIAHADKEGIRNSNETLFHNTVTGIITIDDCLSFGILNRFVSTTLNDSTTFFNEGSITLTNSALREIYNTTDLSISAMGRVVLTNAGTISITSEAQNELIFNTNRSTITNLSTGILNLTRTTTSIFSAFENTESTHHIPEVNNEGTITVINGQLKNVHLFDNSGTINIDVSSQDGINNVNSTAVFNNSGNIMITNVDRVGLNNKGTFNNSVSGNIEIDTSGLSGVENFGATFINHGIIDLNEVLSFSCIQNQSSNSTTSLFENYGSIIAASSKSVPGIYNRSGALFLNKPTGQITTNALGGANFGINNSGTFTVASIFENEGSITLTDNFLQNAGGQFTNFLGASITGNNMTNNNSPITSLFTNAGTLTFDEDLLNSEDFVNESSGIINVGATLVGGNSLRNNGLFRGEGIINLAVGTQAEQINNATWSPGFSPGTMTINGDLDFSTTTTSYQVELESTINYDETIVNGNLDLGGILDVSLLSGFVPGANDLFSIITYTGTLTGTFSSINLPSPEMDDWIVNYGVFSPGQVVIGPESILPIDLTKFKAEVLNRQIVKLIWQTASETNNSHFEIERSQNGIDFKSIGSVEGSSTQSTTADYQFMDESPLKGNSYYRLKQNDINGKFEYSETRYVQINATSIDIQVYPNPTTSILNIQSPLKVVRMKLQNAEGKDILTIHGNKKIVDVSNISKGLYYLHISTTNENYRKLVVIL